MTAANPRNCHICSTGMADGYLDEETDKTYCTIKCMRTDFTFAEMHKRLDAGVLFWTEWYYELEVTE